MGSDTSNDGMYGWPAHEVTITQPFYIGIYEITQAQWETVAGKPSHSKFSDHPDRPVEKVSWFDCRLWLNRLNKMEIGTFRLPTEAEWEYACHAGLDTPYTFIDEHVNDETGFQNEADGFMWWIGNSTSGTTYVTGLKQPNPWGLYDIHGNVWEWCADQWVEPYDRGPQTYPIIGSNKLWLLMPLRQRVAKGNSFLSCMDECSCAYRFYEQSVDYHYSIGFRIVMLPEK